MTKARPITHAAAVLPGEADMLAGVISARWSQHALLVYADWLEEKGDRRGPVLRKFCGTFSNPAAKVPALGRLPAPWLDLAGVTLLQAIRKGGTIDQRDALTKLARPTLLIETRKASDRQTPIGATKLGGCPDLPAKAAWPTCAKGSLAFLGQFKLADFTGTQAGRRLPTEGMLSFFVFNDEQTGCAGPGLSFPPVTKTDTIRVIHTRSLKNLKRLTAPADLGEYNQVAPARKVELVEALDVRESLDIDGSEEVADLVCTRKGKRRTTNHFFGFARYYRMDEPEEFQDNFVHLVTFQNEGDLPFCWGDGADLYYYIREADLRAGKFDAVAVYTD